MFFNHKVVRELAWIIGSCPLVINSANRPCCEKSSSSSWLMDFTPHLKELDGDPSGLLNLLVSFKRLGDYYALFSSMVLMMNSSPLNKDSKRRF